MIWSAMTGFTHYQHYHRLHDHVRIHTEDDSTWEDFRNAVDKFIGDTHRSTFQQSMAKNENGVAVMSAAGILEKPVANVYAVDQIFKPNGKVGNGFTSHKSKPKKKEANPNNFNTNNNNNSNSTPSAPNQNQQKPKPKEKSQNVKGAKQCAWCGDTSHKYFQCKTLGDGKWKDKVCNRCGGKGHPPETCSSPSKSKEKSTKNESPKK